MPRSLVELIASMSVNAVAVDGEESEERPVAAAAVTVDRESYFSWKRWYGTLSHPRDARSPRSPAASPTGGDVSERFRSAIQRARDADAHTSTASSSSSSGSFTTGLASPALSTSTWETSASESEGAAKFDSFFASVDPSNALRPAPSTATLKAPRLLRKAASYATLTSTSVEVPPRSPHDSSVPTFAAVATPEPGQFPFLSDRPPSLSPALSETSSFSSRLASSLRKSASSFTLRRRSPAAESSTSREAATASLRCSQTASDRLRDLLLSHDARVDPSVEPLDPLFDPRLARRDRQSSESDSDDDDDDDYREELRDAHETHEVEQQLLRGCAPVSAFDPDSSDDEEEEEVEDPFAATAVSQLAWMAPELHSLSDSGDASTRAAGAEGDADADGSVVDSPSRSFAPFDPFGFTFETFGPAPPLPPPPPPSLPPRRPPTRIITKKRSFVDPRTRRIRTAPQVTITPSTPERQRTRY